MWVSVSCRETAPMRGQATLASEGIAYPQGWEETQKAVKHKGLVISVLVVIFTFGALSSVVKAKGKDGEVEVKTTCVNRVIKTTRTVPTQERNTFLISAMEEFKAKKAEEGAEPTPEEVAALIEQIKQTAPIEEVVTTVITDDPSLLPPAEVDFSDGKQKRFKNPDKFEKFAEKVRRTKCRPVRTANDLTASSNMAMVAAWSPTWYYCTAEAYAKNITGQKMIRLVQRQDWLVSIYGTVQDYDPVDTETYAYLSWRTSGSTSIVGPRWLTYPWQLYASAKQKFVNSFKVYDIQTRYLSSALTVGPANQCIMSPTMGPGMP
jgi:hypothetical protein